MKKEVTNSPSNTAELDIVSGFSFKGVRVVSSIAYGFRSIGARGQSDIETFIESKLKDIKTAINFLNAGAGRKDYGNAPVTPSNCFIECWEAATKDDKAKGYKLAYGIRRYPLASVRLDQVIGGSEESLSSLLDEVDVEPDAKSTLPDRIKKQRSQKVKETALAR